MLFLHIHLAIKCIYIESLTVGLRYCQQANQNYNVFITHIRPGPGKHINMCLAL